MLREHVIGEAMHALGIPTTRALAVVATGDRVVREVDLPGAVLARVAASHLRVGSFQYAGATGDIELLRRLADHAIARHHPDAAGAEQPYVALYEAVAEAQASLVARWMLVGFVHGVMNTDNTTISGETIDYGPCAFMDAYDPATVFSSIDHGGRYAYGNQPRIVHWNLARLGEALLPLFAAELEPAVAMANGVLQTYAGRYEAHWLAGMRAKLGLAGASDGDAALAGDLLELLRAQGVDHTTAMRSLSSAVAGDPGPSRALFSVPGAFDEWAARWQQRRADDERDAATVAAAMDRVNPVYIPRNHLVEAALTAATDGDLAPFEELLDVVTRPVRRAPRPRRLRPPGAARQRSPRHVLRHLTPPEYAVPPTRTSRGPGPHRVPGARRYSGGSPESGPPEYARGPGPHRGPGARRYSGGAQPSQSAMTSSWCSSWRGRRRARRPRRPRSGTAPG